MPLTLGVSRKKRRAVVIPGEARKQGPGPPATAHGKPSNPWPALERSGCGLLPAIRACTLCAARRAGSPWFSFSLRGKGKVVGRCLHPQAFVKLLIENFFPLRAVLIKHGADAFVGEQLHQDGVGRPPVDDVGPAHARRTASTQQSILGIMPPEMMPSFFRRLTSLTFTTGIRVLSSSLSRSRPRTSVIKISFMAPNDEAMRRRPRRR